MSRNQTQILDSLLQHRGNCLAGLQGLPTLDGPGRLQLLAVLDLVCTCCVGQPADAVALAQRLLPLPMLLKVRPPAPLPIGCVLEIGTLLPAGVGGGGGRAPFNNSASRAGGGSHTPHPPPLDPLPPLSDWAKFSCRPSAPLKTQHHWGGGGGGAGPPCDQQGARRARARPTEWFSAGCGRPVQRAEEWGTWASRTRKRGEAGGG